MITAVMGAEMRRLVLVEGTGSSGWTPVGSIEYDVRVRCLDDTTVTLFLEQELSADAVLGLVDDIVFPRRDALDPGWSGTSRGTPQSERHVHGDPLAP